MASKTKINKKTKTKTKTNKRKKGTHTRRRRRKQKAGNINKIKVIYPINYQVGIENAIFQLPNDNKFYVIKVPNENQNLEKIAYTLKDDEILGAGNGVFTFIIGTEIDDSGMETIHIWSRKVMSIQEIYTKHVNIMQSSEKIYLKKQERLPLTDVEQHDGIIDSILYAGELEIRNEKVAILNLLSGSYMLNFIDARTPSIEVIEHIEQLLKTIVGIDEVIIDKSGKTFINERFNMTSDLLHTYVCLGLNVYVFDTKDESKKFLNKSINMAKLKGRYDIEKRMKNASQMEQLRFQIEELERWEPPMLTC